MDIWEWLARQRRPCLAADVAVEYATRWVDSSISGGSVEEPKAFYGYYSMDVSRNDRIIGMLSVNGYTGDVWYHTWHGEFVRMEEHQMKGGEIIVEFAK